MLDIIQNGKTIVEVARKEKVDSKWNSVYIDRSRWIIPYSRLYMPLDGAGEMRIQDSVYQLLPGKIFLIPAYLPIIVKCDRELVKYWTHFNIFMKDTDVDIFNLLRPPVEIGVKNFDENRLLFERLISYHQRARQEWPENHILSASGEIEVRAALNLLLQPFYEAIFSRGDDGNFSNLRFIKLLNYIEKNLCNELSLEKLADFMHLTPNYVSNLFAQHFKMPLIQYCNSRRIAKATSLLAYSDYSIEEIAWQQGAENPAAFARLFKRHTGESPRNYRRRLRQSRQA